MPDRITTRFAPSPTGLLHLGHAYSALLNHEFARAQQGSFILRIEDIDQGRCRPAFEDAILEDLRWLGISWDGDVWRQSERLSVYEEKLAELENRGLLYRCFKTRKELSELASAPHGPITEPLPQDAEDTLIAEGRSFAWRLRMKEAIDALGSEHITWTDDQGKDHLVSLDKLQDPVLARKDFPTSYHLASVIDDAAQGVNYVWRGEDLSDAVGLHRLLQELFGFPAPVYRHHALITGDDGKRLAKRDKSQTLQNLRQQGFSPDDVRQRLGLSVTS